MANENGTGNVTSGTASEALLRAVASDPSSGAAPAGTAGTTPQAGTQPRETGQPQSGQPQQPAQPQQTGQPQQPGQTGQPTAGQQGPVPYDRHQAAVGNARTLGREDVMEYYGIPYEAEPQQIQTAFARSNALDENPLEFYQRLGQELQERGLLDREGRPPSAEFRMPDPELRSPDGRQATYSATQVESIIRDVEDRITRRFRGEVAPVRQRVDNWGRSEEVDQQASRRRHQAVSAAEQARSLPHFKEHETAISQRIREMDPTEKRVLMRRGGYMGVLNKAYTDHMNEVVIPSLRTNPDEANRRRANGNSINTGANSAGGGSSAQQPTDIKNVDGLAAHMRHLSENWQPRG